MQVQIQENTVDPDATIEEYLPECDWDSALSDEIATITLDELRLHTSGLPAQPQNRADTGTPEGNPFGGYSLEMLCESFLLLPGLPTRGRFSYSNFAYGTLGFLLARAEEEKTGSPVSYEDLVLEKVLLPFNMTSTTVTFDPSEAAIGCARGLRRGETTIRIGEYGVLQGNGALRSTLPDMGRFLEAMLSVDMVGSTEGAYRALQSTLDTGGVQDACTCVSGWCEGWLCPLPNPAAEEVTLMGTTIYTSAMVPMMRKSGDTGGYSLRGAWSFEKGRGAFAVDTCGGCGTQGTSGSAVQRLALILADGPPEEQEDDETVANDPPPEEGGAGSTKRLLFVGVASSHAFPSNTQITVEVREPGLGGAPATVLVASADGQGCSSPATPIEGGYALERSALYGCGWDSDDPLESSLPLSRKLLLLPEGIGGGAVLQEMGADIYLDAQGAPVSPAPKENDGGSDSMDSGVLGASASGFVSVVLLILATLKVSV